MYMYYIFLYLLRDYIWEQRVQFLNSVIKNLKSLANSGHILLLIRER